MEKVKQERGAWAEEVAAWLKADTGESLDQFRERQMAELREARPDWIGTKWEKLPASFDRFAEAYRPGDQIWHFRSPDSSWRQLCGREGYAVVREGQVVAKYVTVMN